MSRTTLRAAYEPAPETLPSNDVPSGIFPVGQTPTSAYEAKNLLAALRMNLSFVRTILDGECSAILEEALGDITASVDRLERAVAELEQEAPTQRGPAVAFVFDARGRRSHNDAR